MLLSQPRQLHDPRSVRPLEARLVFGEIGGGLVDAHRTPNKGEVGTGVDEVVLAGCVEGLAVALLVLSHPGEGHVDAAAFLDGPHWEGLLEGAVGRVTSQVSIG